MGSLNRTISLSGIVYLTLTFLITTPALAALTAFGSISDPAGDAESWVGDITSASIGVDSSGIATFAVTFANGTSLDSKSAMFVLDTDQNPATGFPGLGPGPISLTNDASLIGGEFFLLIHGSGFQASATVYSAPPFAELAAPGDPVLFLSTSSLAELGTFGITYSGTTVLVTLPLASLGGDEGLMNFKVVSHEQLNETTFGILADYATELGQSVGIVAALDADGDGIPDGHDNCPQQANSNQTNTDGANDGGDACDPDDDNDGVADGSDNCPLHLNADQADFDQDGAGDACDFDADGDGVDDVDDQCLYTLDDVVDATGCSIDDLAPCVLPSPAVWKNHGAYVSAVAREAQRFEELGLIDNVGDYVSGRAQSACGSGQ